MSPPDHRPNVSPFQLPTPELPDDEPASPHLIDFNLIPPDSESYMDNHYDIQDTVMYMQSPSRPPDVLPEDHYTQPSDPPHNFDHDPYQYSYQESRDTLFTSPPHFAVDIPEDDNNRKNDDNDDAQGLPDRSISPLSMAPSPSISPRHPHGDAPSPHNSPKPLPIPPPHLANASLRSGIPSALPLQVQAQLQSQQPLPRSHPQPSLPAQVGGGVQTAERMGHTRSPVIAREPTMLESFSRTVRNYVPSSIPIPNAGPSPPLVSRPVSFGSFMPPQNRKRHSLPAEDRGSPYLPSPSGVAQAMRGVGDGMTSYPSSSGARTTDPIVGARWDMLHTSRVLLLVYPHGLQIWDCTNLGSVSECLNLNFVGEEWGNTSWRVLHAAILPPSGPDKRPYLGLLMSEVDGDVPSTFFVYSLYRHRVVKRVGLSGLAAAFVTNNRFLVISTVNPPTLALFSPVTFELLFTIPSSSILPYQRKQKPNSTVSLLSQQQQQHQQSQYHNQYIDLDEDILPSHLQQQTEQDTRPQPVFALSGRLLAWASPAPSHVIPPVHYPQTHTQSPARSRSRPSSNSAVSSSPSSTTSGVGDAMGIGTNGGHTPNMHTARGNFNGASGSSNGNGSGAGGGAAGGASAFGGLGLGRGMTSMTQADLGSAALKVGGSVLSGMKTLGGMAYSAAKSRAGAGAGAGEGVAGAGSAPRFFSRSAPTVGGGRGDDLYGVGEGYGESGQGRDRRYSNTSGVAGNWAEGHDGNLAPETPIHSDRGYYVTVLDLRPLEIGNSPPVVVHEFRASRSQPITSLRFSSDGNSLLVAPKDGQVVSVFSLRPAPASLAVRRTLGGEVVGRREGVGVSRGGGGESSVWHVYNLRRGRTAAVVEGLDWAGDGRWIAVGTRRRTVHVFAVNPYGGKADVRSHVEGRVRNVGELQPLSTEVFPIVRLRGMKMPAADQPKVPLAFTFISSSEASHPANLLPPLVSSPPTSVSAHDPSVSPPTSPYHTQRPKNFQDVLMFDPTDGTLSLRRFIVERHSKESSLSIGASVPTFGGTSISLPKMGGAGRLSISPSGSGPGRGRGSPGGVVGSGLTQMMGGQPAATELTAKDSIIATWNLQRKTDWGEIKHVMGGPLEGVQRVVPGGRGVTTDWLAQAELSTSSHSPRVLPRPIYLSHQFSFHSLGEDYHALIRRYQFDISGFKIEVRKAVEVSAYSAGTGEHFVEGFSSPRDIRAHRSASSFDEPLASALSGGLEYTPPPAILPMLPNGTPNSNHKSLKNAIPIRSMAGLGDGVSESLGRIRREMIHRVRSPQMGPQREGPRGEVTDVEHGAVPVPLEFDEEDDDFLYREVPDGPGSSKDGDPQSLTLSRGGGASAGNSSATASTPAIDSQPIGVVDLDVVGGAGFEVLDGEVDEDDVWRGWDGEDKAAVEEAERFDDISVVGFLDEEQEVKGKGIVGGRKRRS